MERRFPNVSRPAKSFSSFRNVLRGCLASLAAFFLYLLLPAPLLAGTTVLTPVILQLKWKHQFQFAGYYAAIEKGYYRDAGLMVTLREAVQGADPTEAVLSGDAQFGVGGSSLVLVRAEGKPVVALAAILQHSPVGILSLSGSNIRNIHDLAGKRIMLEPKPAEIMALLKAEGVADDAVSTVPHELSLDKLLNGEVDAVSVYSTTEPYQLDKRKIAYNIISPERSGIDFYGDTLFTSQDVIQKQPDMVRQFRAASLRGWKYALEHQDEMIDLILKRYNSTHLTRGQLAYEAVEIDKLIRPDLVEIGYMNPGRWQHIVDTYSKLGIIPPSKPSFMKGFLYSGEQPRFPGWLYGALAGALAVIVAVSTIAIRFHYLNVALKDLMQLRDKAEEKLRKLSAAITQSPVSIVITDTSGVIEYVNPKFCELTGYAAEEVVGQNSRILRGSIQSPEFYGNLWRTIFSGGLWRGEFLNKKKNDELFWEHATIAPIWNAQGELNNFIAIKEDITERKMLQEKLDHMAHHDELTGLPNRALFFDRIWQALAHAKRNDTGFALMFVDLDGFKGINDTYGHDSGDLLLQETAQRLAGCIRDSDTVARMGGDEFAVMLLDVGTPGHIHQVADKMLALLSAPFLLKGAECHVGASIGISVFPQDGDAVDTLMNMADMAMYRVKQGAKNNYAFAS
ncbi:MAG: ABC transporter substrate-binding protein [Oryzomonas sp.]|uniref:ABC transporter substrate-binding protein n=1 Tax=Oryzomonas sp. TaxID=2855186 RepID=UPI00284C9150|nr:ABC transporter substrate-binding protein [Oryzomonas sp.]MDR3580217.1 ABC transporter substrate-binding protein [Oryzomonas sp.]